MNAIEALSACTTPLKTAIVFNPTRPEYYRADEMKAAATKSASPAVNITLSDAAKAQLEN